MAETQARLLVGLGEIGTYIGKSPNTIRRWVLHQGFPAAKLPNGEWASSITLIDSWLVARQRAWIDRYEQSRPSEP